MLETILNLSATGWSAVEDLALLIARLIVGLMFAIAGYYKLFRPKRRKVMAETLAEADIPEPKATGIFVAVNELVFGSLLVLGLLTFIAAGVLLVISMVAFVTVGYESKPAQKDAAFYFSELLIKHQVLIAATLILILAFGAGVVSIDHAWAA